MKRALLAWGFCIAILAAVPAQAALTGATELPAAALCDAAIAITERGHGLPAHLLGAIGRVESGRRDAVTGALAPWPWTIDVEGEGHVYETEAEAIAAVRRFQGLGRSSIDVGCMQVNLIQHPGAFATLEAAFDPRSNVEAAADFLDQLHGTSQDWMAAAGQYHSATPALASPYRARVAAMMLQDGGAPGDAGSMLAMAMPRAAPPMTVAMAIPPAGPALQGMMFRISARPQPPPMSGPGRSLSAYRAMPVALANRAPPG